MEVESWMISLIIAIVGVVATYAVLKNRVSRLETDLAHNEVNDADAYKELNRKIDGGFKKLDVVIERVTILERDTSTHLTLPRAEERFVTKVELELHLRNIETSLKHMDKSSETMTGKLEEIVELIHTNVVSTLSGK